MARGRPDLWIDELIAALPPGVRTLDIGCGPGSDCEALRAAGHNVAAFDLNPANALRAKIAAPGTNVLRADVRYGLPFRDGSFDGAAASLSLHYFPWEVTLAAFRDVRRVLRTGVPFLFRVNASDDVAFGAGTGVEVEPGLFRVAESASGPPGEPLKRFFTESMVRLVLGDGWHVESLRHETIDRFDRPKQTWTCLALAR